MVARFQIYKSRTDPGHFVAIDAADAGETARKIREDSGLKFYAKILDDGSPRIAFNADEARIRIAKDGYYAFGVRIEVRDHSD